MHALPKAAFALLADSELLKRLAERHGLGRAAARVRRLVAGETLDDALAAAAALEAGGFRVVFDFLGPTVSSTASAADATKRYVEVVSRLAHGDFPRHLIVKLSQLGLSVDRATALDNFRRVLDAAPDGTLVRLGVEHAAAADVTLDTADTLWHIGYRNLGISVPAALRRSIADVNRFVPLGVSIRVIRAATREPRSIAYQSGSEIAASFRRLAERLMRDGHDPVFATHDAALLAEVERAAMTREAGRRFEFQLRRGVRTALQSALQARGHIVRIRLPFGQDWFPYVMRQLGNRPDIMFRR